MNWTHFITPAITAIAAAAPMMLPLIPPPYNLAVSAGITFLGTIYHLFKQPPA